MLYIDARLKRLMSIGWKKVRFIKKSCRSRAFQNCLPSSSFEKVRFDFDTWAFFDLEIYFKISRVEIHRSSSCREFRKLYALIANNNNKEASFKICECSSRSKRLVYESTLYTLLASCHIVCCNEFNIFQTCCRALTKSAFYYTVKTELRRFMCFSTLCRNLNKWVEIICKVWCLLCKEQLKNMLELSKKSSKIC